MTTVVAFTSGRESGIHWVRGFELQLDAEGVIEKVSPALGWRDFELRREALELDEEPVVGQHAPPEALQWRR
jgi:hypothetical protein